MKSKAVWISCLLAVLVCGRAANAAVIMTLEQVGSNVQAAGSGTVNLAGLIFLGPTFGVGPQIQPSNASVIVGDSGAQNVYSGISGPTNFGSGGRVVGSNGTGSAFGIFPTFGQLNVPQVYVSGAPLSGTAAWNNRTITSLGVTPGVYTWTWGSGANADSLTLFAGVPVPPPPPVPEPSAVSLLGAGLIAVAAFARRATNSTARP